MSVEFYIIRDKDTKEPWSHQVYSTSGHAKSSWTHNNKYELVKGKGWVRTKKTFDTAEHNLEIVCIYSWSPSAA